MIKQHLLGYTGMNQDVSKSKVDSTHYFSATNVRILTTDQQSSFSLTNEHGNDLVFAIPIPRIILSETKFEYDNVDINGSGVKELLYEKETSIVPGCEIEENYAPEGTPLVSGNQTIIGTTDTRDGAVIATTDDNGWDCIWELSGLGSGQYKLDLMYVNKLGFNSNNLLQMMYNYENSIIEKVYFPDGVNQLRFLNLRQSKDNGDAKNLADMSASSLDIVSKFNLGQPVISSVIGGGSHTSGMIQYAYNLYVLNGSQTTISPLSELQSLDKGPGLGGGKLNDSVGRTVIVDVNDLDTEYTHVRLYAIKYTSYNQTPSISLIADREITDYASFTYYDDGRVISPLSLAEFLYLGSNPIIPKHIESKDSRLFAFNVKEKIFDVDIDARVYGHDNSGNAKIWENVKIEGGALVGSEMNVNTTTYDVPLRHDSVNRDYDIYNKTKTNTEFGAEGKFFKLIIDQNQIEDRDAIKLQFLKDREIYRFAIELFNDLGQKSSPKWMCDFKVPEGNLEGNYNQIRFQIKPEFTTWLNSTTFGLNEKPVGYRILRADRTLSDRTILTQGFINPMVSNYKHDKKEGAPRHAFKNAASKMPSMTRLFENSFPQIRCNDGNELSDNGSGNWTSSMKSETITSCSSMDHIAQTWQFNRLMQMFSPEVLFSGIEIDSSYKLNIVGLHKQSRVAAWSAEWNPVSKQATVEAKFENGINFGSPGVEIEEITGTASFIGDDSFFGPTNSKKDIMFHQVYREFHDGFIPNNGRREYEIYGTPEITEKGAGFTAYNGDFGLRYANHLLSFLQDNWSNCSQVTGDDRKQQVYGANSYGAKCITFAEGPDRNTYPNKLRKAIEEIKAQTGIAETKGVLSAEFVRDRNYTYLGNIYGGNSYEAKSVSSYIEIGDYNNLSKTDILISSPGDTFVQNFSFQKFSKTETDPGDRRLNQVTEIVSFKVESTIDLKNRSDLSISPYDNRWQPRYEEYQDYNRVYSQQPTLVQVTDPGFKFKKVKQFDTRIIATKPKIPGENIDSWTDFLENETKDLDGKYGPINGTINFKDEIYTFQDSGLAHISINPRVQTTGSDGVAVELGTGRLLHDYQYISTKSGTLNKWSIIASNNGFYYYDLINKALMRFSGQLESLSDKEGFHNYFVNNTNHSQLIIDNKLKGTGISTGYNSVNNDIYFTFLQKEFYDKGKVVKTDYSNDYTICFNEATGSFTSFYSYKPVWYINKGSKMLTTGSESRDLWEHFVGDKGKFYGNQESSNITFNASPSAGDGEYTFNNLSYKMEMKDGNNKDLVNKTFDSIQVWNEYQDSGVKPLKLRSNIRRKNRTWNVTLPREENSRNRIKSPWIYIKLDFSNKDGSKMIAHDLVLSYTEY